MRIERIVGCSECARKGTPQKFANLTNYMEGIITNRYPIQKTSLLLGIIV